MKSVMCDECCKGINPGQGHYRIEGEDSHFCSDECLKVSFDKSHGDGCWREDVYDEDGYDAEGNEGDGHGRNEAGGYYSVFEGGRWIPLNLYWTEMEKEEGGNKGYGKRDD